MRTAYFKKLRFFILLVLVTGIAIWLATIELEGAAEQFVLRYGYFGFLVISFIGGLNIFFPLPHLIFVPSLLEVSLDPWALGLIASIGTTVADGVGYIVGQAGTQAFPERLNRFRVWVERVSKQVPFLTPVILFMWAALVPFPNEAVVIPLGIANYGLKRTLLLTFAGNLVFNLSVIHAGNFLLG